MPNLQQEPKAMAQNIGSKRVQVQNWTGMRPPEKNAQGAEVSQGPERRGQGDRPLAEPQQH